MDNILFSLRGWILEKHPTENGKIRSIAATRAGPYSFIIKCDEPGNGSVYIDIIFGEILGNYVDRKVEFSFDGGGQITETWRYIDQHVANFSSSSVDTFCRTMANSSTLLFRAFAQDGTPRTIHFDVSGAQTSLNFVFDGCQDSRPNALREEEAALIQVTAHRRLGPPVLEADRGEYFRAYCESHRWEGAAQTVREDAEKDLAAHIALFPDEKHQNTAILQTDNL